MVKSSNSLTRAILLTIQQSAQARTLHTFIRFVLSGVPGIVLAFSANICFVEVLHWSKPPAYALVVWIQLSLGFMLCRFFVFDDTRVPTLKAYANFAIRIGAIRAADWALYTILVEILHTPYLLAQCISLLIFPVVKFLSVRSIFSAPRPISGAR